MPRAQRRYTPRRPKDRQHVLSEAERVAWQIRWRLEGAHDRELDRIDAEEPSPLRRIRSYLDLAAAMEADRPQAVLEHWHPPQAYWRGRLAELEGAR